MPTTITGTRTTGVLLNTASQDPVSVTGTITLSATGTIAVHATTAIDTWNITNTGTIADTATGDIGIQVDGGGTVTNGALGSSAAKISSDLDGIVIGATNTAAPAGVVTNYGTITSSATAEAVVALKSGGTVTNQAGALISRADSGTSAVYVGNAAGTVTNAGTIVGGVFLAGGGSVGNTGLIASLYTGVYATNAGITVTNAGMIQGGTVAADDGIFLVNGGTVTNQANARITGDTGVFIGGRYDAASSATYAAASVTNAGSINASGGSGIVLAQGGSVSNSGTVTAAAYGVEVRYSLANAGVGSVTNSGAISGLVGISFDAFAGGTEMVSNTGTIAATAGASGVAIAFSSGGTNRLIDHAGAVFTGAVNRASVVELARDAGPGSLAGLGTQFTGVNTVTLDAGAQWTVSGTSAGFNASVLGFAAGDTLDVTDVAATIPVFNGNTLTLENAMGMSLETISIVGGFTSAQFHLAPDSGSGTLITVSAPCFADGTRIATEDGDRAVEHVHAGDRVRTHSGRLAVVRWVGSRRVDCRRHARPHDVMPVRVRAGAFAPGRPLRDLRLSPDHAVFANGMLVPVRYLVNGATIVQEDAAFVTYYHVELASHDIVLAEGLPCESYLDTGNRAAFDGGSVTQAHPDFARKVWADRACAELVVEGPRLVVLREELLQRAIWNGHATTPDPSLEALVDGMEMAHALARRRVTVVLPAGTRTLRLTSRRWVPAHMLAASIDHRALGVAVAELTLDGVEVPLADARFRAGWHAPEPDWRWTDGDGTIAVAGAREAAFTIALVGTYWGETAYGSAVMPRRRA